MFLMPQPNMTTLGSSTGLFYLDTTEWDPSEVDMVIYCNACLTGLGFYCAQCDIAFYADVTNLTPTCTIFYYEALSVLSTLTWAHDSAHPPHRLLIYTDSMNMVEMFHSLNALPGYNNLLMDAVGIITPSSLSLHVFHIAGTDNTVADAISQGLFDMAVSLHVGLILHMFQPPPSVSGADMQ